MYVLMCLLILERHEEEIEGALAKGSKDFENRICYDISRACVDVDRSKKSEEPEEVDVSINGNAKKSEVVYEMDPKTGKAKKSKDEIQKEPKTLSKKDKKSKKVKKGKDKESPDKKKVEDKTKGSVDFMQLDLNDPDSMYKVLAQIKEATTEHTKEFYRKKEEEETKKEEDEERKNMEEKDEL